MPKEEVENKEPKVVDLVKDREPAEDEVIIERKVYENGEWVTIKEIVKKETQEEKPLTIEEKGKAVQEKKIELQYKLITKGLDQEESDLLKML